MRSAAWAARWGSVGPADATQRDLPSWAKRTAPMSKPSAREGGVGAGAPGGGGAPRPASPQKRVPGWGPTAGRPAWGGGGVRGSTWRWVGSAQTSRSGGVKVGTGAGGWGVAAGGAAGAGAVRANWD